MSAASWKARLTVLQCVAFGLLGLAGCEWVSGIGDTALRPRVAQPRDAGEPKEAASGDPGDAVSAGGVQGAGAPLGGMMDATMAPQSRMDDAVAARADSSSHDVVASGADGSDDAGMVDSGSVARVLRPPLQLRFFQATHVWANDLKVCFRLDGASSLPEDVVQARLAFGNHAGELLQTNWARYIPLRISWLGTCPSTATTVEITVTDSAPSSAALGDPGNHTSAITLNASASDAEVLHVLGRMLGFQNEYGLERAPGPCVECSRDEQCTFGTNLSCLSDGFCGWKGDHESIMAAPGCAGIEPGRRLTAWDIAGAQRAYGRKAAGAIVDRLGYCLDDPASSVIDNQALVLWPCYGLSNDTWAWNAGTTPLESHLLVCNVANQNRCVAISETVADAQTSPAVASTCDRSSAAEDFQFPSSRIRALGGLCVIAASVAPDALLTTAECGTVSAARERWVVNEGQTRLAGTSLCAAVRSAPGVAGTELALAECATPDAAVMQNFVPGSGIYAGHLLWGEYCVTMDADSADGGGRIELAQSCVTNDETQIFFLSGPIAAPRAGRCLTSSPDETPELWAGATPCDGSPEQEWDYYW
ncbi:MAG TPA: hypothetical protein VHC69_14290 [Polyangiaceae bacterium]|nr:hypothetical protein [Polyangiaceae bacterium]